MKYTALKIILAGILLLFTIKMTAQGLRSTYFLEGASLRHQMNPAFIGEYNYFSVPFLGNINVDIQGNVGLSNFVFKDNNPNYELTTFLNPSVDRNKFLRDLKDNNKINTHLNLTVLSAGFHAWNGFNTFEWGIKSNLSLNLPYELFDFMKTGMNGSQEYRIKNLAVWSNNYMELAFGHARHIDDKLTVGGKFKVLLGIANIDTKIEDMYIKMDADEWEISAYGQLTSSIRGSHFETKLSSDNRRRLITGFKWESVGIGGYGAGIDLGATYKLREDITLSAAVLDLGFISWLSSWNGYGYNDGIPFKFKGFENIPVKSDGEEEDSNYKSLKEQFDDIMDNMEDMLDFYGTGQKKGRTTGLATTINLGAEYTFPYYDKLTFGLLSSTRVNSINTWTEARLSANVSPIEWLNASLNCGISNYGSSLGWALNFHSRGFNFFTGFDYMATKITPQFIPVSSSNLSGNIGFNVTF